jgi:hypothetical protein
LPAFVWSRSTGEIYSSVNRLPAEYLIENHTFLKPLYLGRVPWEKYTAQSIASQPNFARERYVFVTAVASCLLYSWSRSMGKNILLSQSLTLVLLESDKILKLLFATIEDFS